MDVFNPLYKNQGIHVIASLFTVEQGDVKLLLIKNKNQLENNYTLVGGALYNNETLTEGMSREIYEKVKIKNVRLYQSGIYSNINRSTVKRMIAISYIGVVDSTKINLVNEMLKDTNAKWVSVTQIPKLAYDHKEILKDAILSLRERILTTSLIQDLFPEGFTIPELQNVFELIFNKKFDRRNFRKKILSLDLIIDTKETVKYKGNKPAKLYKFKIMVRKQSLF